MICKIPPALKSILFLKNIFLLGDNCFTILCWFLPYIDTSQPQVYICPLPLAPPSRLPPHPTPLGCHRVLGSAPCVIQQLPISYIWSDGKTTNWIQLLQWLSTNAASEKKLLGQLAGAGSREGGQSILLLSASPPYFPSSTFYRQSLPGHQIAKQWCGEQPQLQHFRVWKDGTEVRRQLKDH